MVFFMDKTAMVVIENKKLDILHINTLDNVGGAAKVAYRLKEGFKGKGHKSWMLVGTKLSNDPDVKQIPKTNKYLRVGLNYLACGTQLQYLNYLNSFQIRNRKDFLNADIVNLHNLHGDYFNPLALPRLTKTKPVVYTLHDMWSFTGHCAHSFDCEKWQTGCGDCPYLSIYPALRRDTTKTLWKIKKPIYKKSDFVIVTPSRWLRDKVKKSMLSDKEVKLIYNGVDETIFRPVDKAEVRRKLGLAEDKTIITFSAHGGVSSSWRSSKDLFEVLRIIEHDNIMFLNLGSSERLDEKIKNDTGWLSIPHIYEEAKMAEYFAASDILLYPTLADNCPLVVLEAMACGTPVIAFNTGGVPELVEHMKTGYVAEHKNIDDLANGVELFLGDDVLRAKAGILARQRVVDKFTLDQQVDNYLKLYAQIVSIEVENWLTR
jgi:glycosyltransferase involved in cell wall biosynthesis